MTEPTQVAPDRYRNDTATECPYCHAFVRIRANGVLYGHRALERRPDGHTSCIGSARDPFDRTPEIVAITAARLWGICPVCGVMESTTDESAWLAKHRHES